MQIFVALLLILSPIKAGADGEAPKKFCYDRPQAEKIWACLEEHSEFSQKMAELNSAPPPESPLCQSTTCKVLVGVIAFGVGYAVGHGVK